MLDEAGLALTDRALARARAWLRDSGVVQPAGGVLAWLAPEAPQRQFVSAEITGYAASYFRWDGETELVRRCATWLVDTAQDESGSFRCRWHPPGSVADDSDHDGPIRWSFDAGIILKGLADAHDGAEMVELRGPIAAAAEALLARRDAQGRFPGRWDGERRIAADDPRRWSTQPGAYHAKIERGLAAAARILARPDLLAGLAARVERYIAQYQAADGQFVSYPHTGGVHAHPHLYACESLWALGEQWGVPEWREAGRRGVYWLASRAVDGRIPRTVFGGRPNFHGRCDAAAQYLRVLLCVDAPRSLVEPARRRLCEFFDPATGAFVFGWNADGSVNRHPDSWGTMAAIQALSWLRGERRPDPEALI